jgi:DNA-binding GntR family transcriptional regulator
MEKDSDSMPSKAKRQQSSLSQTVYADLKELIASGRLKPGSRVREIDLAERLKVSRTPIREALRKLESDGLVAFAPHEGLIVTKLDHQAIIELYAMREVLEGTAARFAARHASEAEVQELNEFVKSEMDGPLDSDRLMRLNQAMHEALYRAGHNRYLLRSLHSLRDALILLGGTTLAMDARAETAHKEHVAIVTAIAERDPEAAEEAARTHIRNALRARLKLLRETELERSPA